LGAQDFNGHRPDQARHVHSADLDFHKQVLDIDERVLAMRDFAYIVIKHEPIDNMLFEKYGI